MPRISGMLRQPSQPSSRVWEFGTISGLMITVAALFASGSSTSSATNNRRLACTCGAASPTPLYSCIVSIMSSMSFCISGLRRSFFSSARPRCRSTGCPMRATFNIDMNEDYKVTVHQHDQDGFRFCPVCAGSLESRLLKEGDPARLVCVSCGFVFYLDPKLAVGTVISVEQGRIVLVRRAIEPGYGKWVFPGGYVDRGEEVQRAAVREAREETGLDVRIDRLINIYSYSGRTPVIVVYSATMIGGCLGCDDEGLEARFFEPGAIPWDELAFRSTQEALREFLGGPEGPPLRT